MATHSELAAAARDKRRWRRVHFTVPVRVTLRKSRYTAVINSQGSLMNPGGISFSADIDLTIGDEVEVALTDHQVKLRGAIRDRAGNQYGVEFLASSVEESEQLARFRQLLTSKLGSLDA